MQSSHRRSSALHSCCLVLQGERRQGGGGELAVGAGLPGGGPPAAHRWALLAVQLFFLSDGFPRMSNLVLVGWQITAPCWAEHLL